MLEELVGDFDIDVIIATLGASAGAISFARTSWARPRLPLPVARLSSDRVHSRLHRSRLASRVPRCVLYNRAILSTLTFTARLPRFLVEWRAAANVNASCHIFAIARALAYNPAVLPTDEPFAALDALL